MPPRLDPELAGRMAVDVVVAYLNRNSIERSELPELILQVRRVLQQDLDGECATEVAPSNSKLQTQAPPIAPEAANAPIAAEFAVADLELVGLLPAVPIEDFDKR